MIEGDRLIKVTWCDPIVTGCQEVRFLMDEAQPCQIVSENYSRSRGSSVGDSENECSDILHPVWTCGSAPNSAKCDGNSAFAAGRP